MPNRLRVGLASSDVDYWQGGHWNTRHEDTAEAALFAAAECPLAQLLSHLSELPASGGPASRSAWMQPSVQAMIC
jgi:hypothetical protein